MPLELLPLEDKDLQRAVALEIAAFDPNGSVSRVLFPNPPPPEGDPRVQVLRDELRRDSACRAVKVVDTDLLHRGDEAIIAYAVWYIVDSPRPAGPVALTDQGSVCNPEACEAFFGAHGRRKQELIGGKPQVYLRVLATDPAHHRRGAGSMILRWGTAEADRLRVPCYLETTPAGQPLYERHGFKKIDSVAVDLTKWSGPKFDVPVLLREALV